MKNALLKIGSLLAGILFVPIPAVQAGDTDAATVLILDASGSMWGQLDDGRTKIEVAREVLGDFFAARNAAKPLGVIAYGHNRRGDCSDIEVIAGTGQQQPSGLVAQLKALNPKGKTPLGLSLRIAASQIPQTAEEADIVLVTDGLETCDIDPCAVADELAAVGIKIRAHVVGFGLTEQEADALACVPDKTGGLLLRPKSGAELADALVRTTAPVIVDDQPEGQAQLNLTIRADIAGRPDAVQFSAENFATGETIALGTLKFTQGDYLPATLTAGHYRIVADAGEQGRGEIDVPVVAGDNRTIYVPFQGLLPTLDMPPPTGAFRLGIDALMPYRVQQEGLATGGGDFVFSVLPMDATSTYDRRIDYSTQESRLGGHVGLFRSPPVAGDYLVTFSRNGEIPINDVMKRFIVSFVDRPDVRLIAPAVVAPGARVPVTIAGGMGNSDRIEIWKNGALYSWDQSVYLQEFFDNSYGPAKPLLAPAEPAAYELVYVFSELDDDAKVAARLPLTVGAPPDDDAAGAAVPQKKAEATPSSNAGHEIGVDRPGMDLSSGPLAAPDPSLCAAQCAGNGECEAWTYVRPGVQREAAMCWLKRDVPPAQPSDCCVSGVKAATSASPARCDDDTGCGMGEDAPQPGSGVVPVVIAAAGAEAASTTWELVPIGRDGETMIASGKAVTGPWTTALNEGRWGVNDFADGASYFAEIEVCEGGAAYFPIPRVESVEDEPAEGEDVGYACPGPAPCQISDTETGLSFMLPAGWWTDYPSTEPYSAGAAAAAGAKLPPHVNFFREGTGDMLVLGPHQWLDMNGPCEDVGTLGQFCMFKSDDPQVLSAYQLVKATLKWDPSRGQSSVDRDCADADGHGPDACENGMEAGAKAFSDYPHRCLPGDRTVPNCDMRDGATNLSFHLLENWVAQVESSYPFPRAEFAQQAGSAHSIWLNPKDWPLGDRGCFLTRVGQLCLDPDSVDEALDGARQTLQFTLTTGEVLRRCADEECDFSHPNPALSGKLPALWSVEVGRRLPDGRISTWFWDRDPAGNFKLIGLNQPGGDNCREAGAGQMLCMFTPYISTDEFDLIRENLKVSAAASSGIRSLAPAEFDRALSIIRGN